MSCGVRGRSCRDAGSGPEHTFCMALVIPFVLLMLANVSSAELENWRRHYYEHAYRLNALRSSPSGMFWDDVRVVDTALFDSRLWPDARWDTTGHFHPEIAGAGLYDSREFVDTSRYAWQITYSGDIRYRRLLLHHTLDVDSRYLNDPGYVWKKDRVAAGRIEEAYGQWTFDHAFVRLGRLKRNWGPFPYRSLVLSSNAHTFDGLEWQVHGPFFEFRHFFAAFPYQRSYYDTRDANNRGASEAQRYLTAHSLNFMLGSWATVGLTETVLFARDAWPDWQYINPFGIYTVTNTNSEGSGNLMVALQWQVHPFTKRVNLLGQMLLDDFQVDNEDAGDQEPPHWGLDVAAYWYDPLPVSLRNVLSLTYTYRSKWLYLVSPRNTESGERYTYLQKSLGYPTNDGDRWELEYSVIGNNFWDARIAARYARDGGNTVTSPWVSLDTASPASNGYRTETSLRSDTVQHTIGMSLEASAYWRDIARLTIGVDNAWVKNRDNEQTASFDYDPRFSAQLTLACPHYFWPFPLKKAQKAVDEAGLDDPATQRYN